MKCNQLNFDYNNNVGRSYVLYCDNIYLDNNGKRAMFSIFRMNYLNISAHNAIISNKCASALKIEI